MNFKRICRSLMCLLLACCLLFNVFPQKAEATGAGVAAATITGAATVTVTAPMVIGASLIALGITYGTNDDFQRLVDTAVSAAGDWVKDGTVELLQTVNSAGEKAYYAAGEMLERLRLFVLDDVVPQVTTFTNLTFDLGSFGVYRIRSDHPLQKVVVAYQSDSGSITYGSFLVSNEWFVLHQSINGGTEERIASSQANGVYYVKILESHILSQHAWQNIIGTVYVGDKSPLSAGYFNGISLPDSSDSLDVSLGYLPSQTMSFTDGTVTDNAFKDYLNKRIRFRKTDNPQEPDGDEAAYSWLIPLSLSAAGTIWAKTQADQWTGITDTDFDDYTVVENLTVTATPTVGGYPGVLTTPNFGSGSEDDDILVVPPSIGGGATTITPSDGLSGTLSETGAQSFLESIGSFFATWFDSFLQWLKALFELIRAGVISLGEAIAALPAAIADAISAVLTKAFAISDTFIQTKVEALKAKYPYLDTFLGLGTNLKGFFMNLGTKPPIIYIDLGSATGSYLFGGKTVFVDLTWYSQYKGLMDSIIGAFIWLWLAWRVFLSLPGIIQGEAGTWGQKQNDIGMGTTAPPIIFTQKALPSGKRSRGE